MIQQSVSQQYAAVDPNTQIREDLEELKHEYVRLDSGLRVAKWIIGFFIAASPTISDRRQRGSRRPDWSEHFILQRTRHGTPPVVE